MSPYPSTLPVRLVSFSPPVVMEVGVSLTATLTVSASRSLYHEPSDTHLVSVPTRYESTLPGSDWEIALPVTDDPGMRMSNGGVLLLGPDEHTHTYTATLRLIDRRGQTVGRETFGPFAVPSSIPDGTHILDLLGEPTPIPGTVLVFPQGPEGPQGPPGDLSSIEGHETHPDPHPQYASALVAHENDPTPHPAYDEGPSLALIYQNAKV